MRLSTLFVGFVSLASLALSAPTEDLLEPEILVAAAFPEENPFGHVVNGEKNKIVLSIENKSERNVSLLNVAGSFHQPDSNALVKNTTSLPYGVQLLEGVKLQLPYTFYSEFKPGDLRLHIWLEHSADGEKYRVTAYDSIVTIVEPEGSILDFKLASTYLIVAALFGGLSYYAYLSFAPQSKKPRSKKISAPEVSPPVSVTATGVGGYQEEWIPEHHLKKPKASKKKSGVATSGDDFSGAETSGAEDKRRKARK